MNEPKLPLALTHEERLSPLWQKLKEHWEARLSSLRKDNDREQPESATAQLRGRLAELKLTLSLDRDVPRMD